MKRKKKDSGAWFGGVCWAISKAFKIPAPVVRMTWIVAWWATALPKSFGLTDHMGIQPDLAFKLFLGINALYIFLWIVIPRRMKV